MPKPLVHKRCFVQLTGYEPVGAEHSHRRYIREMARFLKAWSLQGHVSPVRLTARRFRCELDGGHLGAELAR